MHILLLALNYYPDKLGNAPLLTGISEGLVALGHRVTVVCAFPHHETGQIEAPYRGKLFQRDHHNGVDILRTYIYAREGGTLAKMANYASFTATALAAAATVRGVDLILTPSPPLTLGLVDDALARLWRVPFVYNLQDLFPEAAVRLGVLKNPRMIQAFQALERFVYREATHLSVISEGFKRTLLAKGVPEDKLTVIPNFTDTAFITPQETSTYRSELGLGDDFVVQFSGRMGLSQGLETVIGAWKQLSDLPGLRLMMVGDGQARPQVEAALGDDPRVSLLPTQPREKLPDLLAAADVGLAPLKRGMAHTSVPSKVFGIMASGRPVIAGVEEDSDTAELVHAADAGLVAPPEDASALATAIRTLYQARDHARAQGQSAREYVVAHHSQAQVARAYEALFLKLLAERKA